MNLPPFRWLAIASAYAARLAGASNAALDALDEAILNDLLVQYTTHEASTCTGAALDAATAFTFDYPGNNADSDWSSTFIPYEQALFQVQMSHVDPNNTKLSWSMRIGTSGNMYSHRAPNAHGETMPPQRYAGAPWVDEVHQTVSVNGKLNQLSGTPAYPQYCTGGAGTCKPYYIHQAGAYMKDTDYMSTAPFFSPSLARHCSGNSCSFASWGTSAHVVTPFTSPIIYINRFTNCGNGVIEHTMMIHNFANPNTANSIETSQDYFDVPWTGVRSSSFPYALEPALDANTVTRDLEFSDPNSVRHLKICKWGGVNIYGTNSHDAPGSANWLGMRDDVKNLGGYTTFVEGGLLVNSNLPTPKPWCRVNSISCSTTPTKCMAPSCTDEQIAAGTHTRLQLKVAPNSIPTCTNTGTPLWPDTVTGPLFTLKCKLHDLNFGQTTPSLEGAKATDCAPWVGIGFKNTRTGEVLEVAFVRHWSWASNDQYTHFVIYERNLQAARQKVHNTFDNRGFSVELPIEVVTLRNVVNNIPTDYNPGALNSFTFVYGRGEDYGVGVQGAGRRRIGGTQPGSGKRDYTVFNLNWWANGAVLEAGSTYVNRMFYFHGDLQDASAKGKPLSDTTFADEIGLELWNPRSVDIYKSGGNFAVVAALSERGTSTSCGGATLACSGYSTPKANTVPFYYVTCGASSTYLGPDPYVFAPSFGASFPRHGNITNPVRSYVCKGEAASVRPTWKLMGFFNPTKAGCLGLGTTVAYDESAFVCPIGPSPTSSPTKTSNSTGLFV